MNDIIKYGIIGIGGMGANHANLFLQNKIKNGSLEAICDTNDEFAKNFPNIPFYKKVDSFFDKKLKNSIFADEDILLKGMYFIQKTICK